MTRSPQPVTIAFHKPYGVLPCFTDPAGWPMLADYIAVPGVYPAGRLDLDSEGLMILTSDGALAHRLPIPGTSFGKSTWRKSSGFPMKLR